MRWVRHRWAIEGPCGREVAEALVECCSPADEYLRRHFEAAETAVDVDAASVSTDEVRLGNGWIRFG